jgi:hypothetical protein
MCQRRETRALPAAPDNPLLSSFYSPVLRWNPLFLSFFVNLLSEEKGCPVEGVPELATLSGNRTRLIVLISYSVLELEVGYSYDQCTTCPLDRFEHRIYEKNKRRYMFLLLCSARTSFS